jgi:hypothetical protein
MELSLQELNDIYYCLGRVRALPEGNRLIDDPTIEKLMDKTRKEISQLDPKPKKKYYISGVRRGKGDRRIFIYANLYDENHELLITATLDYILDVVELRGYELVDANLFLKAK